MSDGAQGMAVDASAAIYKDNARPFTNVKQNDAEVNMREQLADLQAAEGQASVADALPLAVPSGFGIEGLGEMGAAPAGAEDDERIKAAVMVRSGAVEEPITEPAVIELAVELADLPAEG